MSPDGVKPSRASEANATADAATCPFMSSAPRPQISPSTRSPDHGSRSHSAGSTRTVSVWLRNASVGPSPPGIRATRFARSGTRAMSSLSRPSRARYSTSTSAAAVSFPGGLTVSTRRRSCSSAVDSARRLVVSTATLGLRLRERCQLVPDLPELRERRLRDEAAEELDRRALRPDDRVADRARDHLVVPHAPELGLLVELEERLRKLVQILVIASLDVELQDREARLAALHVERLPEPREDPPQLVPAGRVEPGPVAEHLADLLVLPGRHVLEHLELRDEKADAEGRAPQQPQGAAQVVVLDQLDRRLGVVPGELQPELGALVRHLEEQLVAVDPVVGPFLKGEQLLRVQVPLVVGLRVPREHRLRVVLRLADRLLGLVSRHGLSILAAWATSSRTRHRSFRLRTRLCRRVCGRARWTSSSGSSTSSARDRRCGSRSPRTGSPR